MRPSLYRNIFERLLQDITNGQLMPGDRLPAEAELERSWGVSRITASRAIRELQQLGLVQRIPGSGSYVSQPLTPDRQSAHKPDQTRFVAAVFPQIERNGIPEILTGIEQGCAASGQLVTYHNSHNELDLETKLIRQLRDQGCAGLLLYPCYTPLANAGLYSSLKQAGFPIVMIDRSIDWLGLPLIACDNASSMAKLCQHVLERGHRRIGFLCNSIENISSEQERFHGYATSLLSAGLSVDTQLLYRSTPGLGLMEREKLPDWATRLQLAHAALDYYLHVPDPPSCIMAVNDVMAISLQKAAMARGLRIPEDLAITGFDHIDATNHIEIPITTMAQPFRQIGREAAEILLSLIDQTTADAANFETKHVSNNNWPNRRIMAELVVRQST